MEFLEFRHHLIKKHKFVRLASFKKKVIFISILEFKFNF